MASADRNEQNRSNVARYRTRLKQLLGGQYGLYRYLEKWIDRKGIDRRYFLTGSSLLCFARLFETRVGLREEAAFAELRDLRLAFGHGQHAEANEKARGLIMAARELNLSSSHSFSNLIRAGASTIVRDCGSPINNPSSESLRLAFRQTFNVAKDVVWQYKTLGDSRGMAQALTVLSNLVRAYAGRIPEANFKEAEEFAQLAILYSRLGEPHNLGRVLTEYQARLRELTLERWYINRSIRPKLAIVETLAAELNSHSAWAEFRMLEATEDLFTNRHDLAQARLRDAEDHLKQIDAPMWLWLRLWKRQMQILRCDGKNEELRHVREKFLSRWSENPDYYQPRSLPENGMAKPVSKTMIVGGALPGFYSEDVIDTFNIPTPQT